MKKNHNFRYKNNSKVKRITTDQLGSMPQSARDTIMEMVASGHPGAIELKPVMVPMSHLEVLNDKAIKENFGASIYFDVLKESLIKDIAENPQNYNETRSNPDQSLMIVCPLEVVEPGNNVRCAIYTPFQSACFIEIDIDDYIFHMNLLGPLDVETHLDEAAESALATLMKTMDWNSPSVGRA